MMHKEERETLERRLLYGLKIGSYINEQNFDEVVIYFGEHPEEIIPLGLMISKYVEAKRKGLPIIEEDHDDVAFLGIVG